MTVDRIGCIGARALRLLLSVVLLATTTGCGTLFQSVTAYRKYANEDPEVSLVADRADDVLATIELVDYMLTQKAYSPGDDWVKQLPLDDAEADRLRTEIRGAQGSLYADKRLEIPVVKLYRLHLAKVLEPPAELTRTQPLVNIPVPELPRPSPPSPQIRRPTQRPPSPSPSPPQRPNNRRFPRGQNAPPPWLHTPAQMGQAAPPTPAPPAPPGAPPLPSATDAGVANPTSGADDAGAPPPSPPSSDGAGVPPNVAPPTPVPPSPPFPPAQIPTIPPVPPQIAKPILETLAESGALKGAWDAYAKAARNVTAAHLEVERWERFARDVRAKVDPPELVAAKDRLGAAKDARDAAHKNVEAEVENVSVAASDPAIRDALSIISTALRADLEAVALIPTIAYQSIKVIRNGHDVVTAVGAVNDLAPRLSPAKRALDQDIDVLDKLVKKLGKEINQSKDEMAGWLLKDSLVDDIAGITLDWIHLRANAGIDMMVFSPASLGDQSSEDKKTYDYTGRLRKAEYDIKPIVLANASLAIGFDSFRLPEAGKISLGYKTDRQWKSGGNIESGSLGGQLGFDRRTSDLIDLGLQLTGARSSVKIATFDAGTFKYENATTGALLATAPFRVQYTQVDVGWDFAWLIRDPNINSAYVGFRYLDYRLPRLLYELEDQAPAGSKTQQFTYFNESAPQQTTSRYYLGGVEGEFDFNDRGVFVPYALLAFYAGAGPASFLMKRTKAVECPVGASTPGCVSYNNPAETNRVETSSLAAVGSFGLGFRVRAYAGRRFSFYGEASYRLDVIYSEMSLGEAENGKEHTVDFGGPDFMHTMHAGLNLNF